MRQAACGREAARHGREKHPLEPTERHYEGRAEKSVPTQEDCHHGLRQGRDGKVHAQGHAKEQPKVETIASRGKPPRQKQNYPGRCSHGHNALRKANGRQNQYKEGAATTPWHRPQVPRHDATPTAQSYSD